MCPRKFYSDRCRQANYRAERAANPSGDAELQAALDDTNRRLQAAADAINDPTIWRLIRDGSEAAAAIVAVASHVPEPT
jgi:hypothetical protein